MKANFLDLSSHSGGARTPFLTNFLDAVATTWKTVDVKALPAFLSKCFKSFEASDRVQSPKNFRTRLVKDQESVDFRAMLRRVDSDQEQRSTFNATALWADVAVPETEDDNE